jgi:hypothetical protein
MTGLDLQDVRLETLKGSLDSSNIANVDHIFGSDFPTSATSALRKVESWTSTPPQGL